MISYLSGKIKLITGRSVIIDVQSVGYEVFVLPVLLEKNKNGNDLSLFTYLYVREDIMELYGFDKIEEKVFFKDLISVSGIGPKSALTIMSLAPLADLKKAIVDEDVSLLTKVSGVGKKTAERLILELKNKLDVIDSEKGQHTGTTESQAIDGLVGLGYTVHEAREALRLVDKKNIEVTDRIKAALKLLGKK